MSTSVESEDDSWKTTFEEIPERIYVSRPEKKFPKRDDVMECDCKYNAEPGERTCVDASCLNYSTYTECLPGFCHKGCGNNRIRKHKWCKVKVSKAGGKGYGLFAMEKIPPHYFIGEYIGEVISIEELNRRKISRGMSTALAKHLYYMGIDTTEAVDATYKGGVFRYVNHSCRPNAVIEKWRVGNEMRLAIMSLSEIQVGEEIGFDYSWDISLDRKKTKCLCGSPECRGFIEKFDPNSELAQHHLSLMSKKGQWRYPQQNEVIDYLEAQKQGNNMTEQEEHGDTIEDFQGGKKLVGKRLRILEESKNDSIDSTMVSYTYLRVLAYEEESSKYKVVDEIDYDEYEGSSVSKEKEFFADLRASSKLKEENITNGSLSTYYKWQIYDEDSDRIAFSKAKKEKAIENTQTYRAHLDHNIFKKEIDIPQYAHRTFLTRNSEMLSKIMNSTGTRIFIKEKTSDLTESMSLNITAESEESIENATKRIESLITVAEKSKQRREQQKQLLDQMKSQNEDEELKQQQREENAKKKEQAEIELIRKAFPSSIVCYGFNYSTFPESHIQKLLLSDRAQSLIKKAQGVVLKTLSENLSIDQKNSRKSQRNTTFLSHLVGASNNHRILNMVKFHSHLLLLHYIVLMGEESFYGLSDIALAALLLCYKIHCYPRGTAIKDFFHFSYDAKYSLPLGTCNLYSYQSDEENKGNEFPVSGNLMKSSSSSSSINKFQRDGFQRGNFQNEEKTRDIVDIFAINSEEPDQYPKLNDLGNDTQRSQSNDMTAQKKIILLSEQGKQWTEKILTAEAKLIHALRWDFYIPNPFTNIDQIYVGCVRLQEKGLHTPILTQLERIYKVLILEHSLSKAIWLRENRKLCTLAIIFITAVFWCVETRQTNENLLQRNSGVGNVPISTGELKSKLQEGLPLSSPDFLKLIANLPNKEYDLSSSLANETSTQSDPLKKFVNLLWILLEHEYNAPTSKKILPGFTFSLYDSDNVVSHISQEKEYLTLPATCSSIIKVIRHYISVLLKEYLPRDGSNIDDIAFQAKLLPFLPLHSNLEFKKISSGSTTKMKLRGHFVNPISSSNYVTNSNFRQSYIDRNTLKKINQDQDSVEPNEMDFYMIKVPTTKHQVLEDKLATACRFSFGGSIAALKELYILQDLHRSTPSLYCPYILLPVDILLNEEEESDISKNLSRNSFLSDFPVEKPSSLLSTLSSDNFSRSNSFLSTSSGNLLSTSSLPSLTNSISYMALQPYITLATYLRALRHFLGSPNKDFINNGIPSALTRSICVGLLRGLAWIHKKGIIFKSWDTNSIYLSSAGRIMFGGFDEAMYEENVGLNTNDKANKKFLDEEWDDSRRKKKVLSAPEVLLGGSVSKATDIWSAGCICAHLIIGKPLFDTRTPRKLIDHITRVVGSYDVCYPEAYSLFNDFPYLSEINLTKRSYRLEKTLYEIVRDSNNKRYKHVLSRDEIGLLSCMLALRPSARISMINLIQTSNYCTTLFDQDREEVFSKKGITQEWNQVAKSGLLPENSFKVARFGEEEQVLTNFMSFLVGANKGAFPQKQFKTDEMQKIEKSDTKKEVRGSVSSNTSSSSTNISNSSYHAAPNPKSTTIYADSNGKSKSFKRPHHRHHHTMGSVDNHKKAETNPGVDESLLLNPNSSERKDEKYNRSGHNNGGKYSSNIKNDIGDKAHSNYGGAYQVIHNDSTNPPKGYSGKTTSMSRTDNGSISLHPGKYRRRSDEGNYRKDKKQRFK